jgi:putative two-component system response regulator
MKKVLLVDNDPGALSEIATRLMRDFYVAVAVPGEQVFAVCAREKPDLILLDIEGLGILAKLRSSPNFSHIPVIAWSQEQDTEAERISLGAGARDYLLKGVADDILWGRMNLHLKIAAYQSELERTVQELSNSVALSIADMIECRDEKTGGHVARTSRYVGMLGRALLRRGSFPGELTASDLDLIVQAAPLHDIGKIAISDRILLKPDRLDDEEFVIMKSHTTLGQEILDSMYAHMPTLRYLRYASVIAVSHHERYDGRGYPHRLQGEEIPLSGRIMAVADVYDALVDDRVYRRGLRYTEACRIIIDGGGTSFDPQVVAAFESISTELNQIAQENIS